MNWSKGIALLVFCLSVFSTQAQVPEFDKLEMLFAQGHYKKVYRLSNRLLDKPEYDYSMLPTYYKALSLFQLIQNEYYFKKHPEALETAKDMLLSVRHSNHGGKIYNAHMYELSWLKSDMTTWASDLKRMGYSDEFKRAHKVIGILFEDIPDMETTDGSSVVANEGTENDTEGAEVVSSASGSTRDKIVVSAKEHIGTPYQWAGNSPEGFDCSGFTSYIMQGFGVDLPRRSSDQYDQSKKVKEKNVQKGDLVFFNNGSGISHVGIVVSEKGEPIVMIHSSSSKGIILTEIGKSEYWMKRLHGFGTYVN